MSLCVTTTALETDVAVFPVDLTVVPGLGGSSELRLFLYPAVVFSAIFI